MITINVKGYNDNDKIQIAKYYLIPELLKQFNINSNYIKFTDDIIKLIIIKVENEEGVRNLKRGIESIISWINIQKYLDVEKYKDKDEIIVTNDDIDKYLKTKQINESLPMMYL